MLRPYIPTRNAQLFLHGTYHSLRRPYNSNRSRHTSAARMEVDFERYETAEDPCGAYSLPN
jgi:hypothetical protein